ncbi:hypothetical protein V5T82_15110 [Magnetovibrio sp. PR-2]|uniref:hypothetical protein n=1 Tax=Magnetovibrio sp. PR-2 TaxID=3120356 RepID=UPI002FCE51E0
MNKVAVYIGTTNGPVRIEQITNEPAPLTEVFKGRDITALSPISESYENFVRPSRPVERAFGPFTHPSFRMDLSDDIKSGESWRLAVFVAHGLSRSSRLARLDENADHVIWLTGRVNADFEVDAVGHIEEKLCASKPLFDELEEQGIHPSIFIPQADGYTEPVPAKIKSVNNVFSVLDDLDIPHNPIGPQEIVMPDRQPVVTVVQEPRRFSMGTVVLLGGILALSGFGVWAGFSINFQSWVRALQLGSEQAHDPVPAPDTQNKNEPIEPKLKNEVTPQLPVIVIYERRAPDGSTCADVQFGGISPQLTEIGNDINGAANLSASSNFCGLKVVYMSGERSGPHTGRLEVLSGRYVGQQGRLQEVRFEDTGELVLDLPRAMVEPFHYQLTLESLAGASASLTHQIHHGK